ncbi:MAG TPA: lipid-A-disaccharide synthase-related protein [Trichocoleus sp.]|jgi:uncharacterized protein (TIGR03492 family)
MRLLCLSNGHGEDQIALRILQALQQQPHPPEVMALPLVGEGQAYIRQGIPLIGTAKTMPSGGFIYMDGRQLARDLRGGLLQLTRSQLQTVQAWAKEGGVILAVGDIVPLLFAWWSGAPYAFVGTAKSEYYLRDEMGLLARRSGLARLESWSGSVYLPWERWLMSQPRCKAVFPRDTLTTHVLKRWQIPAFDLGNPMMDGLEPTGMQFQPAKPSLEPEMLEPLTIALLPGSRTPEAYENWQIILQAVAALCLKQKHRSLLFVAAVAPGLDQAKLQQALAAQRWQTNTAIPGQFQQERATLILTSAFNDCLHQADLAIAMAGTATEQFVGLGKPAITLPGQGPQFTAAFAEAQTRLLGSSVVLADSPNQVPAIVTSLLQDPDRLYQIQINGQRRMGNAGAADRIATCLLQQF